MSKIQSLIDEISYYKEIDAKNLSNLKYIKNKNLEKNKKPKEIPQFDKQKYKNDFQNEYRFAWKCKLNNIN